MGRTPTWRYLRALRVLSGEIDIKKIPKKEAKKLLRESYYILFKEMGYRDIRITDKRLSLIYLPEYYKMLLEKGREKGGG
jgi:hypothetical protein